jgi:hypothetical protein
MSAPTVTAGRSSSSPDAERELVHDRLKHVVAEIVELVALADRNDLVGQARVRGAGVGEVVEIRDRHLGMEIARWSARAAQQLDQLVEDPAVVALADDVDVFAEDEAVDCVVD